jgi:hypothetical protein
MFPQTGMTWHLMKAHGVSPRRLAELWRQQQRLGKADSWDEFLKANDDVLHMLEGGEAVRGLG